MKPVTTTFLLFLAVLMIRCDRKNKVVDRPIDPWVFRSVLDRRPRMISLALNKEMYAAYDAEHCGLYKIWKGGLDIHGAPFDGIKTVQPTSWGHDYATDSLNHMIWSLRSNEKEIPLRGHFKGYEFLQEKIYFKYLLTNSTDSIWVREGVDFIEKNKETHGLLRQFETKGIPEGSTLILNSLDQEYQLTSSGRRELQHLFSVVGIVERVEKTDENLANRGLYWLERSGCGTCHEQQERTVGPGYSQIAEKYERNDDNINSLIEKVKTGGSGVWGDVPMIPHPQISNGDLRAMISYILSLNNSNNTPKTSRKPNKASTEEKEIAKPGFGSPLVGVHPSYTLSQIRPEYFKPKVAAMDFMNDGSLLVTTWDSLGAVYRLKGVEAGDPAKVTVKRIAAGLAEPLGIKVVEEDIFVQQKHELTQLIDHNGDEIIDEYKSIWNDYGATADFHEFALGLEYKDGYFYTNLSLAMRLMEHERQLKDRGHTIKVSMDGTSEHINFGLRQPNGLGIGIDGELFITENQGRWVPANKLMHVQQGVFHGSRAAIKDSLPDLKQKPPAVWLPQDEIGNSPSQPLPINDGPYMGQMIHGEVAHGGIKRVFLEKIDGEYQGCVFRFTQGLEVGINRMVWGPDGALYVGGVGMSGNWGWNGKKYGLQRLMYNGKTTFEMLAIRAKPNGLEITFTEPLGEEQGKSVSDYLIQQWWYLPTSQYGGPKKDLETLNINEIIRSEDGKRVSLVIPGLKAEHVVYIRLKDDLKSITNQPLWTSESWYTLNKLPK